MNIFRPARLVVTCMLLFAAHSSSAFAADEAKPADSAPKITYTDNVQGIFRNRCGSCHNANDKKGGLVLDNYASALQGGSSGSVFEAGDPGASYLWQLVNHEAEPKMPPNQPKLPDEELNLLKQWIEGGLLENAGSQAKKKKQVNIAKIEVSGARPEGPPPMPVAYVGDPAIVPEKPSAVTALAVSPWAPLAAVSGHKEIVLYDTRTFQCLGTLPFPEGQPHILKFSRNGGILLAGGGRGGASGKIVLWDIRTAQRITEIGDEYDSILAADISPDQTQVALGGPKKMLRVYNTATGELLFENKKHTDWITAIEFSPDGVLLASADRSNGLVVWEAVSGREYFVLQGHSANISDVSWRPDSNVLASASEDGTIRLWEMNNGGEIKRWAAHGGVASLEYTRDGRLISTGRDRMVRLWNGDGAQIREFPGMTDLGLEASFDSETERALGGDWTGNVRVWNAADGALLSVVTTNPITLAARIESLKPQLVAAQSSADQSAAAVAALKKAALDKQQAADTALAQAQTAMKAAQDVLAAKKNADDDLKVKVDALKQAEVALQQAEQALAAAKAALEKAANDRVVANANSDAAAKTVTVTAEQVKATQEAAATAQAAADQAQAAAKPTPESEKALANTQAAAQAATNQLAAIKTLFDQLTQWQQQLTKPAPPATAMQ